jgi:DUF1680 family protein
MADVTFTTGFWAERFNVCKKVMMPSMMSKYKDVQISHAFRNFEIAAGLIDGEHKGPSFHDGDFYKIFEAMIAVYAHVKDTAIDNEMDNIISVIAKAQRGDGYIHTPSIINEKHNGEKTQFNDKLNFETYNFGHLFTAASLHYRVTGKTNFLNVAIKAADYLYEFYKNSSPQLARNTICPSHYMGLIELYRTTGNKKYLELAINLINLRGKTEDGTDDNQDRLPFRQQTKAMGHAVRANYLYAGVADVYIETGDDSLLFCLNSIWNDVVSKKLYITGGCGALYDGVSPDGTSYQPNEIQKVHQAYGRDYQLPNFTAHNESCANIGNLLWNYRMLLLTGDAKYTDIIEQTLYNSILAGVSLDGEKYFYTNPLAVSDALPFKLRWSKDREEYISFCNCCPPNTIRTIAEASNYFYSLSDNGLYINLYGANILKTHFRDGSFIGITQYTNYPWEGNIKIVIDSVSKSIFSLFLRIPSWCNNYKIIINGKAVSSFNLSGIYAEFSRKWKKGDIVELQLPMNPILIVSNPLIEETRNMVAVRRGPLVYCLESIDLPQNTTIFDFYIPHDVVLKLSPIEIGHFKLYALEGYLFKYNYGNWNNLLYKQLPNIRPEKIKVKLIPYYAWNNRGHCDMTVWLPIK